MFGSEYSHFSPQNFSSMSFKILIFFFNLTKAQLHQTLYFISLFYFLIYFYYFVFIYLFFSQLPKYLTFPFSFSLSSLLHILPLPHFFYPFFFSFLIDDLPLPTSSDQSFCGENTTHTHRRPHTSTIGPLVKKRPQPPKFASLPLVTTVKSQTNTTKSA